MILSLALLSGCREQILHNLSEIDVTRIESRLETQGISAVRERQPDGRWTISVHADDSSRAIQLIESHRLLREERAADNGKSSMLASREDQRFHYERSLSRELESTLGTLDGVLEARVHLNLPPLDPIFGQPLIQTSGTASVLLIASPEFRAHSDEVAAMIAGASGIPSERVAVLLSRAYDPTPPPGSGHLQGSVVQHASPQQVIPAVAERMLAWTGTRAPEVAGSLLILGVGLLSLCRAKSKHHLDAVEVVASPETPHVA